MDIRLANEIVACLPKDRTLFHYYEDRYAAMLLERVVGDGMSVSVLKSSRFGRLLNRPAIKRVVARKGNGVLLRDDLLAICGTDVEHYVLTIGLWGWKGADTGWCQTSRRGVNIVLQLNFCRKHDRLYRKLIDPHDCRPYALDYHPVCKRGRNTLAWARLDFDLEDGEVLVEEVQNDWLRQAEFDVEDAQDALRCDPQDKSACILICGTKVKASDVLLYRNQVLRLHRRLWAEAMLAAVIWFLTEEIGINRIWYHDHETGARLKNIPGSKPPRSLYSDLPRRFCFERTCDVPGFIAARAQKKMKQRFKAGRERFWRLNL